MCSFTGSEFDIGLAAGWYSAIAGLLAGFALLSVLLPLDHDTADRSEKAQKAAATGVIVFTSAFFALLILSFSYAILSGRPAGAIAAHEQQLNGAAFGLSSLLMLLGLREVLHIYGGNRHILAPAQDLIDKVVGIWGPLIVIAVQFSNTLDLEAVRANDPDIDTTCFAGLPIGIWVNGAIAATAAIILFALPLISKRISFDVAIESILGRVTLGFTIFVTIWIAAFVPFLPEAFIASTILEHATFGLTAAGTVAFGASAWLSR